MSNQTRPYEPLTSENAALILVDHQVGFMTGVRDYSTGDLKHNAALTKAAKSLKLPIVVTTTARYSMWGSTFPELVEALPGIEIIDRSSVNAFEDERVARAIIESGRKKLIFAGLSLEVCAALPAMTAVRKGLDAQAKSHMVEVPGASHSVYVSKPKEVAAVIEEAASHALSSEEKSKTTP